MPKYQRCLNSIAGRAGRGRRWLAVGGALLVLVLGIVFTAAPPSAAASPGWSISPSPNSGTGLNVLDGVSCHPAASCQAVGYYLDATLGQNQTLIESWNGTSWTIVPSPNNGTGLNVLNGVSCATASSCEAVGYYYDASLGADQTLIESWNGASWSIAPSPNDGTAGNILQGVSCHAASRSCQAVGYFDDASLGADQTLIESWNGANWSIVQSPSEGTAENILFSVSCQRSDRSCQAVGYYLNAGGFVETLIESWNGTSWSISPSPDNGTNGNYLLGVSCHSANSCEAVGQYEDVSLGKDQTLIESWNGTTWTIEPSPDVGTNVNDLLGVSCHSPNLCEAVGLYLNASLGQYQTLIETWKGTSWTIVPSPNDGAGYNVVSAVSCRRTARSCQAVGNYYDTSLGVYKSLIESPG